MDGAFAWLSQLVAWFGQFVPRWEIIATTHGGVKFVRGAKVVTLGPGIHWYWPALTVLKTYPVARQAVNLASQTLTTRDNRTVVVGGLIVYRIDDIEKILAHTYDPEETIRDISASAIHDVVCCKTWEEIKDGQRRGTLDRALRAEAKKSLDGYGVTMLKTTLTDLALARVLRLIQSTSQD